MSGTFGRLAGLAWLTISGVAYPVVSEPTWGVATIKRKTLPGMDRVHGYSEEIVPGFIAVTLRDTAGTSIAGFQGMVDVTVSLLTASGKRVSGTGMWTTDSVEVNSTEATFAVRFEGEDVTES